MIGTILLFILFALTIINAPQIALAIFYVIVAWFIISLCMAAGR